MKLDITHHLKTLFIDIESILAATPSNHYKTYKIPKRKIGFRIIAQPTPKIKKIQREIVDLLESHLPIHQNAKAYQKGSSIVDNAKMHLNTDYLLKMDILNFFNSITPNIFFNELEKNGIEISKDDKNILKQFLFWNRTKKKNQSLVLSVGAPSSPFISNFIMFSFDSNITQFCNSNGIVYTRYADDLTFSTKDKNILFKLKKIIIDELKSQFSGKLLINESKTIFSSKAHNRHITGITLTNNNTISIGHKKKRYISSLVHKFKCFELSIHEILYLKGLLAFVRDVEPLFLERLAEKHGESVLTHIKKYNNENIK